MEDGKEKNLSSMSECGITQISNPIAPDFSAPAVASTSNAVSGHKRKTLPPRHSNTHSSHLRETQAPPHASTTAAVPSDTTTWMKQFANDKTCIAPEETSLPRPGALLLNTSPTCGTAHTQIVLNPTSAGPNPTSLWLNNGVHPSNIGFNSNLYLTSSNRPAAHTLHSRHDTGITQHEFGTFALESSNRPPLHHHCQPQIGSIPSTSTSSPSINLLLQSAQLGPVRFASIGAFPDSTGRPPLRPSASEYVPGPNPSLSMIISPSSNGTFPEATGDASSPSDASRSPYPRRRSSLPTESWKGY